MRKRTTAGIQAKAEAKPSPVVKAEAKRKPTVEDFKYTPGFGPDPRQPPAKRNPF